MVLTHGGGAAIHRDTRGRERGKDQAGVAASTAGLPLQEGRGAKHLLGQPPAVGTCVECGLVMQM